MFTNVLFLILILLCINIAPQAAQTLTISPGMGLFVGLVVWVGVVVLIAAQNIALRGRVRSERMAIWANCELIVFFLVYHFLLGAQRPYEAPVVGYECQTLVAAVSLALYFAALFVFHVTSHKDPVEKEAPHYSHGGYAWLHVRFLLPFAIPFLLYNAAFDLFHWGSPAPFGPGSMAMGTVAAVIITVVLLAIMIIIFPWILHKTWGCQQLKGGKLVDRLEALCKRTGFTHAGIMTWPVMRHSLSAAVLGVTAKFRYIMFTRRLIENLDEEEVEAVLAHEIGHSRHHHLLLYPLILFGLVVAISLHALYFAQPIEEYFALKSMLHPDTIWSVLKPIAFYLPYALIVLLYFRFIFGAFSRRFERQADLFVFESGVPAEALTGALDKIATYSGYTHHQPSWHHYGIQDRIDYLHRANESPMLVASHHRGLITLLWTYVAILIAALVWVLAPFIQGVPGVGQMGAGSLEFTQEITEEVTENVRKELAQKWYTEYRLVGDKEVILEALEEAFLPFGASTIPGAAQFYAAQYLFKVEQYEASAQMMTIAWETLNRATASPGTQSNFDLVTQAILQKVSGHLADQLDQAEKTAKGTPAATAAILDPILPILI